MRQEKKRKNNKTKNNKQKTKNKHKHKQKTKNKKQKNPKNKRKKKEKNRIILSEFQRENYDLFWNNFETNFWAIDYDTSFCWKSELVLVQRQIVNGPC